MTVTRTAPATARYWPRSVRCQARQNRPDLQADEDERQDVQREHRRLPHRVRRDARARGRSSRRGRATVTAKHTIVSTADSPRCSASIQTPNVRDELQDDRRRDVLHTIHDPQQEPSERRTGDEAAGDREEKCRSDVANREGIRRDGANRQPVNQQRGRVVQQAFAFEHREDAVRQSQLAQHGGCRDRIWWRDHRAQRDRRRPRHRRHNPACDDGDGGRRQTDGDDDQPRDRRPVVPEIPERRVVRRVEQDGRDEERECELGRERERRCDRKEREQRPAEREEHRIRGADAARAAASITAATKRPRSCSSSPI